MRALAITIAVLGSACAAAPVRPDTGALSGLLERQTQALLDAVTAGRADVWDRYTAPGMVYTAEDGSVKTKADLVAEIRPLPPHISGALRVTAFVVRGHRDTAIATYIVDEQETYYGQAIRARYRQTDTWIQTPSGWRLIAAQVVALRDDPPAIALPVSLLDEYVGTYALTPEVRYTIRRDGDGLVGQRTGRDPEPLRAEVADVLFVPGRPRLRTIIQRGADGKVTGFVERRETWDVRWTRAQQ